MNWNGKIFIFSIVHIWKLFTFHKFVNEDTGKFISFKKAKELVKRMKIGKDNIIVNYCGGGIAATLDAFILYQLGFENLKIYDNSMSEWALDESLPINI